MSGSNSQILNPDSLATNIVTAFKNKSYNDYKKLFMDAIDYKEMLKDYLENNPLPIEEQRRLADAEKQFSDSADVQYAKAFGKLLDKGAKLGIDWTQIRKDKFIFSEDKPSNSNKQSLTGHLNFIYKDSVYIFWGVEAIKLSSGYKISDIRTVLKGGVGENVDADLLDDEDL
jgi:hypothetical protein